MAIGFRGGVEPSPAVMRAALPQASPAIYLALALGITCPFNLVAGIPRTSEQHALSSLLPRQGDRH